VWRPRTPSLVLIASRTTSDHIAARLPAAAAFDGERIKPPPLSARTACLGARIASDGPPCHGNYSDLTWNVCRPAPLSPPRTALPETSHGIASCLAIHPRSNFRRCESFSDEQTSCCKARPAGAPNSSMGIVRRNEPSGDQASLQRVHGISRFGASAAGERIRTIVVARVRRLAVSMPHRATR